jgi:hypothetical protein
MKKFSLLLILFLVFIRANAQQEISTAYSMQSSAMFAPLDKTKIPHGILLDFGMEFTNLKAYNGTLTDSTAVNSSALKDIYNTLFASRIVNTTAGFINPNNFDSNWWTHRKVGNISVSGLYFKYTTFINDAINLNKVNFVNNQFTDKFIGGVWQNPYQEFQTFAMAPAISKYEGLNFQVKVPSTIFYSNYQNLVQSIQIDFDNGAGFVTVPFNQNIDLSYATAGIKVWKYKLNLTNGTSLLSQSKIVLKQPITLGPSGTEMTAQPSAMSVQTAPPYIPITATKIFEGAYGSVKLTISDLNGDGIRKPLIVAEGFDPGIILSPESWNGKNTYSQFINSIYASLSNDLNSLLTYPSRQYDIIYVDWDNGVDYLERNAFALEEVIKWVNTQKAAVGSTEKNVVLGQSMGGVIARYALADMEKEGIEHDTRLFVSHDAPQQGANIPISVQYMFRHLTNLYIQYSTPFGLDVVPTPVFVNPLLDQPATKQLLTNWSDSNYTIANYSNQLFYSKLRNGGLPNSGGYPVNCRNVAISNGAECGTTQNFSPGDDLIRYNSRVGIADLVSLVGGILGFTAYGDASFLEIGLLSLWPGSSRYSIDFNAKAIPYGAGNQIYKGRISYTKKLFSIFGWAPTITVNITNVQKSQPSGVLPLDTYGGGYYDTSLFTGNASLPSGTYLRDRFNFIPTTSALDIGKGIVALTDSDFKMAYVGATPPVAPKNSPFINFTTSFDKVKPNSGNKAHISFDDRNGRWLAKELTETPEATDCSYICASNKIFGAETICTSENYSAPTGATTYNWYITQGASLVTLTGNGTPTATLTSSDSGFGYVTLQVIYGSIRCGNKTLTKKIYVGLPTFNNLTYKCAPSLCFTDISAGAYYFSNPVILNSKSKIIANFSGLTTSEAASNLNWDWQEEPSNHILFLSGTKNSRSICAIGEGTTILQVRVQNACGWSDWVDLPITIIQLPSSMQNRQSQSSNAISLKATSSDFNPTSQFVWNNENIWIRNAQDGIMEHQNPVYSTTSPNYLYVKIYNTGCGTIPSSSYSLKTYWAKSSTSLNWPKSWNDAKYNSSETSLGGQIGEVAIPELGPEQDTILSMPFLVPDPEKYQEIFPEPWRFGFLARAVSQSEEMTNPETDDLVQNVINNENIGWKNTTMVDCVSDIPENQSIGGVIAVGNTFDYTKSFYLELIKEDLETGKPIYEESEVSLKLDDVLYQAWVRGGKTAERLNNTLDEKIKLVKDNNVFLKDLELNANETGTLYIKFNFLTKEITDKTKYVYHVIQRETGTNKIIGGETYVIKKQARPIFIADAGGTKYVDKNEPITISAAQISESAVYNWYDADGNFITSGKDLNIATEVAQKYKLEVIAADGFKDYTEVEVKLNPNTLGAISPNPVVNSANITYKINEANSAYLMILGGYGTTGDSNNYILDIDSSVINIDLSYYSSGFYTVALVCDGQIVDAKTLVKE